MKNRKTVICGAAALILMAVLLIFWVQDRNSALRDQNHLNAALTGIIRQETCAPAIEIQKTEAIGSKIALYYSYGNGDKSYAVGLFKKTLLPPYVKMINLGLPDGHTAQSRGPLTDAMPENINLLLLDNTDRKVDHIRLRFDGEPVGKKAETVDVSKTDIYFDAIEMNKRGGVYFDGFFDQNNSPVMP